MSKHLLRSWEATARRDPGALALIDGPSGQAWTRGELAAAIDAWHRALPDRATLRRHRVVMAEANGARWFQVFAGLLQAGAIPVSVDPAEPLAGLRAMARSIGAAWLWADGRLEPVPGGRAVRRNDLCLFKLTSGSSGAPKALPFTHGQMLADGRQVCASMGIAPGDVNLAVIPLGHSYGLGNLVIPLLAQGTALVCAASPLPHALANDCARWRPTVFPAVPTLLHALVRSAVDPAKLASLRLVISAGAPLAGAVAAEFARLAGRRVHAFYGSTETGGITYDRSGDATLSGRSVGTPLDGVRLHFRDDARFVVESAAVGGRGRFMPPDYAKLNESGELVLLGRTGRLVKVAGRRLDLAEVECALLQLPEVRAACAGAHPRRADRIAALVETELSAAELRARLAEKLAPWKIPDRLVPMTQLPMTARGKIDRQRVAELLAR